MKPIDRDIDLNALTDFNGWYQNTNLNLIDYAGMKLTLDLTIAVIDLFFPKFALYRGAIRFEPDSDGDPFDEGYDHFDGDFCKVSKIFGIGFVPFFGKKGTPKNFNQGCMLMFIGYRANIVKRLFGSFSTRKRTEIFKN